jgi:excisionase family DNA binding protein
MGAKLDTKPREEALPELVAHLCSKINALVDLLEYSHGKPLTQKQVAARLGVDVKTVQRRIDSKQLKAIKVEGVVRVRPADLERYLEKKSGGHDEA